MSVGNRIKELRKEKGWTTEKLGLEADLSPSLITLYENGSRKYTQKSLEKIADALGVPMSEFFKDEKPDVKYDKSEEEDYLRDLTIHDRDLFEGVVKEFKDLTDKDKENIREVIRLARNQIERFKKEEEEKKK